MGQEQEQGGQLVGWVVGGGKVVVLSRFPLEGKVGPRWLVVVHDANHVQMTVPQFILYSP